MRIIRVAAHVFRRLEVFGDQWPAVGNRMMAVLLQIKMIETERRQNAVGESAVGNVGVMPADAFQASWTPCTVQTGVPEIAGQ